MIKLIIRTWLIPTFLNKKIKKNVTTKMKTTNITNQVSAYGIQNLSTKEKVY